MAENDEIKALLATQPDSSIEAFITGYATGAVLEADGVEYVDRIDGVTIFRVDLVPGRKFRIKVELVE